MSFSRVVCLRLHRPKSILSQRPLVDLSALENKYSTCPIDNESFTLAIISSVSIIGKMGCFGAVVGNPRDLKGLIAYSDTLLDSNNSN